MRTFRQQMTAAFTYMLAIVLAAFCFAVVFGPDKSRAQGIGRDKYKHAAVSAGLGMVARSQIADPWRAWAIAMAPGVAKEVYDARKGGTGFSFADLVADGVGAYVGVQLGGLIFTRHTVTYTRSF